MSKYDPLFVKLSSVNMKYLPMSFTEIEKILGFGLPQSSKQHRAWWSNNPSNNVMTKAWLNAGYITESVDIAGEKLVFRKSSSLKQISDEQGIRGSGNSGGRHPVFGCMAGTVTVAPGVDLTDPADPEWGHIYE